MNAIAKLKMTDEGQALILPDGMALPGTTASVRQEGNRLVIELQPATTAAEPDMSTPEGRKRAIEAFFADMDRFREELGEFMPEGREQPPMPPDRDYGFD